MFQKLKGKQKQTDVQTAKRREQNEASATATQIVNNNTTISY